MKPVRPRVPTRAPLTLLGLLIGVAPALAQEARPVRAGAARDGFRERTVDGALEVRIPWLLINVTDPPSRTVLQGPGVANARGAERGADGRWRLRPGVAAWPDTLSGELGSQRVARPEGDRPPPRQVDPAHAAWVEGDTERAYELYTQRLAADPRDGVALHRLALMRAWREEYGGALELFDRLIEAEPANLDARVDRARVQAWAGDHGRAIDALDGVLEQQPGHRGALEARALFQAWAGRYAESISTYDRLLVIAPDDGDVRRQQARVMGWASDFEASRSAYEQLLARDPSDVEARLGLATALAFSDDLDGALREYDRLLTADARDVRALRGRGRVLGWANRLVEAEAVTRAALALDPADVETLVVLGQILQWQGRSPDGLEVLERAVALDPTHGDARQQLRALRLATLPMARPASVHERDSDGNRMRTTSLRVGFHPMPRLDLRLDGYRRDLELGALERVALGATLTAAYQLVPGWILHGAGGVSRTDGTGTPTAPVLAAGVRSPERHRAAFGIAVGTGGLDETAPLAERGVRQSNVTASLRLTPAAGWRVDGALGRFVFDGSEKNVRTGGSLALSRRLGTVSLGSGVRVFGYDEDLDDGYFDPDFYGIAELTGAFRHRPLPWSVVVEAAPGVQQVTRDGDRSATFRGTVRVAYLLTAGRELSVSWAYSSAGLLSLSSGAGGSGYSYRALSVALDWVF